MVDQYSEEVVRLPGGQDMKVCLYPSSLSSHAGSGDTRWCLDRPWEWNSCRVSCARLHYGTSEKEYALSEEQFARAFTGVEQRLAKGRGGQAYALRWLCSRPRESTVGMKDRWTEFSVDVQIKQRSVVVGDVFEIAVPRWNVWAEAGSVQAEVLMQAFWTPPGWQLSPRRFTLSGSVKATAEDTKFCISSGATESTMTIERSGCSERNESCLQEELLTEVADGFLP